MNNNLREICPVCNSKLRRRKKMELYLECIGCRCLVTKILYSEEQIRDYYSAYKTDAIESISNDIRNRISGKIIELTKISGAGNFYDFGFGSGIYLIEAQKLGLKCFGYEYSDHLNEKIKELGVVIESDSELHSPNSEKMDIFIVIETLEHLINPTETLKTARARLRNGGVLYMTTPNARSLNRKILAGKWSVFNPPEHLVVFSRESVRKTLTELGFSNIQILTTGFNPHDFISNIRKTSTLENSNFSYEGVNRTNMSRKLISLAERAIFIKYLFRLINWCLVVSGQGDSLKISAVK